jgi:hypothetical protein
MRAFDVFPLPLSPALRKTSTGVSLKKNGKQVQDRDRDSKPTLPNPKHVVRAAKTTIPLLIRTKRYPKGPVISLAIFSKSRDSGCKEPSKGPKSEGGARTTRSGKSAWNSGYWRLENKAFAATEAKSAYYRSRSATVSDCNALDA